MLYFEALNVGLIELLTSWRVRVNIRMNSNSLEMKSVQYFYKVAQHMARLCMRECIDDGEDVVSPESVFHFDLSLYV